MKYKQAEAKVQRILDKVLEARDSDGRLTAEFWWRELKAMGVNPRACPGIEIMRLIGKGRLTSAETITRARRKLQEKYPQYRGRRYYERKHRIVPEIIEALYEND